MRNIIEDGSRIRTLGRIGGTAVLAGAALLGVDQITRQEPTAEAGGQSTRRVSCKKVDWWYPIKPDQTLVVTANAVVIPSDIKVNGVDQFDNDADTATVFGMISKDKETIRVDGPFGGSADVLACGTSQAEFYEDLGRQSGVLEKRNDKNNPQKRVNLNILFK